MLSFYVIAFFISYLAPINLLSFITKILIVGLRIHWLYPFRGVIPAKKTCAEYNIKLYLMMRAQWKKSNLTQNEKKVHIHTPVRVPSIGQIDLFKTFFIFNRTMCKENLPRNNHMKNE